MSTPRLEPSAARRKLDSIIREKLREAFDDGLDTAPRSASALTAAGNPARFDAISQAVDRYLTSVTAYRDDQADVCAQLEDVKSDMSHSHRDCPGCGVQLPEARDGDITVVESGGSFVLTSGHRMRAGQCPVCHELIGNQAVTVSGFTTLPGKQCTNGCLPTAVFLIHAHCRPQDDGELAGALGTALSCDENHPWS